MKSLLAAFAVLAAVFAASALADVNDTNRPDAPGFTFPYNSPNW